MLNTDVQKDVGGTPEIRSTRTIRTGKIPSLDGLRAVSIMMVIAAHLTPAYGREVSPGSAAAWTVSLFNLGPTGVTVFFVISGYLITHLLLLEIVRYGTIDLKRFYFRRSMRIFPPLYVFLTFLFLCGATGHLRVSHKDLWSAAGYMSDYANTGWLTHHTWSLAVEEQFYLVWPLCLRYSSVRSCKLICACVIFLSPAARLLSIHGAEPARQFFEFQQVADSLATGCFLALHAPALRCSYGKLLFRGIEPLALAFVIVLGLWPSHPAVCPARLYATLGLTAINLGIGVLVLCTVERVDGWLARILNTPALAAVGVLSYSLYLWQQLFTDPDFLVSGWRLLVNLFAIGTAGALSYWLIERPSLRLRTAWERRLFRVKEVESFRAKTLSEQVT